MSLRFEGETLTIGGEPVTGTVLVEARVTDGSFTHEFGTEHVADLDFLPAGFVPDDDYTLDGDPRAEDRAVSDWISSHEKQVMAAYERAVKKG